MKELYWPEFETALEQKVSAHIAQSPELLREYRNRQLMDTLRWLLPRFGYGLLGILLLPATSLVVGFFLLLGSSQKTPVWWISSVAVTCISIGWASNIREKLLNSPAHQAFRGLPVPDTLFFDFAWRKSVLIQIGLFFLFSLLIFGGLFPQLIKQEDLEVAPVHRWLKVLIGIGITLLLVSTIRESVVWLAHRWTTILPKAVRMGLLPWGIFVVGLHAVLVPLHLSPSPWGTLELFTLIFPTSWVCYAFHHGILNSDFACLVVFVPAVLFIAERSRRFQQWRASFSLEGHDPLVRAHIFNPFPQIPLSSKPVHKESSTVLEGSPSAEQDPDLMIALVRRTLFAPGFDLAKEGWVEQLSARYLTQSEQHIVEFMAGSKKTMSWTKLWAYSFVTTLGINLCLFILPDIVLFWGSLISRVGSINLIILFAALKIVAFLGMCCLALSAIAATLLFCLPPVMSFLFDGFRLYRTSEKTIPMYAVYPIGFWPMIRIQWKLSLVRLVLSFPAICFLSFGINSVFRLTPGLGVELAFKCMGILLIITVLGLLLAFSDGTTSNVISIYKTINGIGIILTGVGIFRLTDATIQGTIWQFFSVWLVMITLLFLWLMVFGKLYNTGKVDLLRKAA